MPQRQCALCDVELTPKNNSEEHLLPNAIGGRRTVSGFLCAACNNRTGSTWDVEVARQLHFLTLKLGVVRERGETPAGEFKTLSGAVIRIHPDGRLSYPASKPTITEENGAVHIQIQARTRADAAKTLQGLKRRYPKLDVDAALAQIVEQDNYLSDPIHGAFSFGNGLSVRSVVKSALALAVASGADYCSCNLALDYLRREEGSPSFGYYNKRDLVEKRPENTVFHCVSVLGDPVIGKLIGYVELYSVYRMVIGLSDQYTRPAFQSTYAIDPTSGDELKLKVDLSFTEEELRLAINNEDDVAEDQRNSFDKVMTIIQQRSLDREQQRVAQKAWNTTMTRLGLVPGQAMTPEIALRLSQEITREMEPFLRHRLSTRDIERMVLRKLSERGDNNDTE